MNTMPCEPTKTRLTLDKLIGYPLLLIFTFLFLATVVFGQAGQATRTAKSDPAGVACDTNSPILEYNNGTYTCVSSAYALTSVKKARYATASRPTCSATSVGLAIELTDGNKGVQTCKNTTGSTYAWIADRPEFDVRNFGAVGDGSTDDSTAINAAVTAAALVGGRVVFSPNPAASGSTVYRIATAIELKQGVTYEGLGGAGPNAAANAATIKSIYVKPVGAIYAFQDNGVAMNGIEVKNLTVDLSDTTTLGAFYLYGVSYSVFNSVRVSLAGTHSSARQYGFRVKGGAYGAYSNTFINCDAYNSGTQGALFTGFHFEDSANNNYVQNCIVSGADKPYVVDGSNAITFLKAGGDFGMFTTFTFQNNSRQNTVVGGRSEHGAVSASFARAANVVTATHDGSTHFQVGQEIRVTSAVDATFLTTATQEVTIASVPTNTTFTYAQTAANASTTGTLTAGIISQFDNGSYNNAVLYPHQINACRAIKDSNATYSNYLAISDNLGQFDSSAFLSLGNDGSKVWGTTISAPGNITTTKSIVLGNDGGVSISFPANNALRSKTAVATDTLYFDFPRVTFRDNSNAYATTGSNINGAWTFNGNTTASGGNFVLDTAGKSLQVKTGSNACAGSSTLSSGTVTVSTTCTGSTWGTDFIILLTPQGSSTGVVRVSSFTGATSFVITSTDAASADKVGWLIVKLN